MSFLCYFHTHNIFYLIFIHYKFYYVDPPADRRHNSPTRLVLIPMIRTLKMLNNLKRPRRAPTTIRHRVDPHRRVLRPQFPPA